MRFDQSSAQDLRFRQKIRWVSRPRPHVPYRRSTRRGIFRSGRPAHNQETAGFFPVSRRLQFWFRFRLGSCDELTLPLALWVSSHSSPYLRRRRTSPRFCRGLPGRSYRVFCSRVRGVTCRKPAARSRRARARTSSTRNLISTSIGERRRRTRSLGPRTSDRSLSTHGCDELTQITEA